MLPALFRALLNRSIDSRSVSPPDILELGLRSVTQGKAERVCCAGAATDSSNRHWSAVGSDALRVGNLGGYGTVP